MPLIPCWRMMVSMAVRLIPLQGFPRQIRLGLHVMDGIHFDILVGLVELDASSHTGKILGCGEPIADRLRIFGASLYHIGNQDNLIVGVGVKMGGVAIELRFEVFDEIADDRSLIVRIELHDPDIADCRFAGFLLEPKWQPNRAQLDGFAAATFDDARLRQSVCDLEALGFQRVSWNHIDAAVPGKARGDGGEVVYAETETDVLKNLAAQLSERIGKYFGVADAGVGILVQ